MSTLEEVYQARGLNEETQAITHAHDEPVQEESTGQTESTGADTSSTPEPQTETTTPEVDWRAEAEKARKAAEEAERKAKGLEQAIAAVRQKVREQPQPSFTEDPEAFVQRIREETAQQIKLVRIETAQTAARARHADYDEMEGVFASLVEQNPYLVAQLQQAQDPAEFAYRTAKFHREMEQSGGSIEALRERIAAEIRAEQATAFQGRAQSLPKTLSGATGTGRTSAQVFTGPTPLDDIYAKKGK